MLRYFLNMSQEEADNTECTIIDKYLIMLSEIRKGEPKKEMDEIEKQFMGYA